MRRRLIETDLIECVLGLGPNLFYNSPMEACIVICRTQKPSVRKGRVVFIDAVREVARERALSFLRPEHQMRILMAYQAFVSEPGFAAVATNEDIFHNDANLSIPLYVRPSGESTGSNGTSDLGKTWTAFDRSGRDLWLLLDALVEVLDGASARAGPDG